MKAVVLERIGSPDGLKVSDVPEPITRAGEVVVRVRATALNYADLLQRRGTYKGSWLGTVLGMECAGTISEIGPGVEGWRVGDEVCALVSAGAYAEKVSVPVGQLLPIPAGVDLLGAAALPEAAATVWSNVIDIAGLNADETLLVHGGAGGVGSFAVQVAAALGAKVLATAGDGKKLASCRDLGASRAISYRTENFVEVAKEETAGRGVDVILDNMGGEYLERNVDALAYDGRIAMIGLQGGREAQISLGKMMGKRASLFTTSLRDRPDAAKGRIIAGVIRDIWPLFELNRLRPVIDRVFRLDDIADAHRHMEAGVHIGKVLVTVG